MKVYLTQNEAKLKIKSGIDKVCDAIKLTIGPGGANAIIGRPYQKPLITNDGITIANEFMLEDELEQLGVQIVQEALKSANEISGDGTTTTATLIQAILEEAFKVLDPRAFGGGENAMKVRKDIDKACKEVVANLKGTKLKSKKEIAKVATISVESEYIGGLIADIFDKLGKDALITTQDGYNRVIETDSVLGTDIDGGLIHEHFANNDKGQYVEDYPIIYTTNKPLKNVVDIDFMLKHALEVGKKSLIVVAEHFEKSLLDLMLHNKISGKFTVIPIKVPTSDKSYLLKDLATLIESDVLETTEGKAGTCEKIIVSDGKTVFLGTKGVGNIKNLQEQMEKAESLYDKDRLKKRIQKLSGGVGVIRVDAETETEREYLKLKIEDAINATRCALEEGVVKGGGLALKEIADTMEVNILTEALKAPYKQIQENAGGIEIGEDVLDPVKVTRTSLEKACSIVGMVITTSIAINDKKEEEK